MNNVAPLHNELKQLSALMGGYFAWRVTGESAGIFTRHFKMRTAISLIYGNCD